VGRNFAKMKLGFISCILFLAILPLDGQTFADQQLNFERVRAARLQSESRIIKLFKDSGFSGMPKFIYWRSFKLEDELELWATDSSNMPYRKVKTYHVCKGSGDLGPKRKFGDMQVPEGLYYIERFNPNSTFHLSLKIAYPNESDLVFADKENPGNEIYMHGGCVSVGCLPMTDSVITEIYWLNVLSQSYQGKNAKIPIDIFPCHFTPKNWTYLKTNYSHKPLLIKFWQNLEEAYVFFQEKKIAPGYWVDQKGKYNIIFPLNYHLNDPNH
jgi:murein L,D-transpeptidase YafK